MGWDLWRFVMPNHFKIKLEKLRTQLSKLNCCNGGGGTPNSPTTPRTPPSITVPTPFQLHQAALDRKRASPPIPRTSSAEMSDFESSGDSFGSPPVSPDFPYYLGRLNGRLKA